MIILPTQLSYTQDLLIQSSDGTRLEVLIPFPDVFLTKQITLEKKLIDITDKTIEAIRIWQIAKTIKRLDMLQNGTEPTLKGIKELNQLANNVSFLIVQDV